MAALLTPEEVATQLGISRGTVYNWAYQRRVRSVKVGRCLRFRPEDIQRLIKPNTMRAVPRAPVNRDEQAA